MMNALEQKYAEAVAAWEGIENSDIPVFSSGPRPAGARQAPARY